MTRIAVLADVQGNLPALEAVARDVEQFRVAQVVVAGDVINWGPYSEQVLEFLADRSWPAIRGNHEFYLLDYGTPYAPAAWEDSSRYPLPAWLRRQLAGKWHNTIAAWPDTLSLRFPDAPSLLVVHGTPHSPWEAIYPLAADEEVEAALEGVAERTVVTGHTHLAMDRYAGGKHIINPGSAGVPLDGIFGASYAILDGTASGWQATFRRVPFDYAPLFREFERQRFIEECGIVGALVVAEFRTARPQVYPFMGWHSHTYPGLPFSEEHLAEFFNTDTDEYNPPAYRVAAIQESLARISYNQVTEA